jgi:flagellar motor switch protein FliN
MSEFTLDEQSGDEEPLTSDEVSDDWVDALAEQGYSDIETGDDWLTEDEVNQVAPLPSTTFTDKDIINEIPVTVSFVVGETDISFRKLSQLAQGSVIELDRLAGEKMDILANGTIIGYGEVVVVNEKYGVRILDLITEAEALKDEDLFEQTND